MTDVILQILLFTGITVVVLGTVAAVGLWLIIRRVRRSSRLRHGALAAALTLRSLTRDTAGRRLARSRLALLRSARATERALEAARSQGRPLGELPLVAARLEAAGDALDEQLHLAEGEPDPSAKRSLASELGRRADRVSRLSGELRHTLAEAGYAADAEGLDAAGSHLWRETEALHAWSAAYEASADPRTTSRRRDGHGRG